MRRVLLAMLILLFAVDAADARRKRHRYGHHPYIVVVPQGLMAHGMHEPLVGTRVKRVTHLRGERTWIAVSGFRQSRIFYRKAVLACAGATWKYVAFEYPTELKREMDQFVILASQALDNDQTGCDNALSSKQQ